MKNLCSHLWPLTPCLDGGKQQEWTTDFLHTQNDKWCSYGWCERWMDDERASKVSDKMDKTKSLQWILLAVCESNKGANKWFFHSETITNSPQNIQTGKVSVARDALIDQPLNELKWKYGHKAVSRSEQPFNPWQQQKTTNGMQQHQTTSNSNNNNNNNNNKWIATPDNNSKETWNPNPIPRIETELLSCSSDTSTCSWSPNESSIRRK